MDKNNAVDPAGDDERANIAGQCLATASSQLAGQMAVDGGSGTLRDLLNDAARALLTARAAPGVPADVLAAVGRMCQPLDKSWLGGATAEADARCMASIKRFIDGLPGVPAPVASEQDKIQHATMMGMADCMAMVRADLIEMGIIDKSVAPMFIPEAVAAYVKKAHDASPAAPIDRDDIVEHQYRTRADWHKGWTEWEKCTKEQAADYIATPLLHDWHYEVRALCLASTAPLAVPLPADQSEPTISGKTLNQWWVAACESSARLKEADACIKRYQKLVDELRSPAPLPLPAGPSEQPAAERWADILRIQRAEAETGDAYMRGLYNGMAMMCANFDNAVSWEPIEAPATPAAPADQPAGSGVRL